MQGICSLSARAMALAAIIRLAVPTFFRSSNSWASTTWAVCNSLSLASGTSHSKRLMAINAAVSAGLNWGMVDGAPFLNCEVRFSFLI